jgi:hypothetical protein
MVFDARTPRFLWSEAVATANYLTNRSPTRANSGVSPFQRLYRRPPELHHLRVFGCLAFVQIPKERRTKLDAHSTKYLMVGYSEVTKGYRFYDPAKRSITISNDAKFAEHRYWHTPAEFASTPGVSLEPLSDCSAAIEVLAPQIPASASPATDPAPTPAVTDAPPTPQPLPLCPLTALSPLFPLLPHLCGFIPADLALPLPYPLFQPQSLPRPFHLLQLQPPLLLFLLFLPLRSAVPLAPASPIAAFSTSPIVLNTSTMFTLMLPPSTNRLSTKMPLAIPIGPQPWSRRWRPSTPTTLGSSSITSLPAGTRFLSSGYTSSSPALPAPPPSTKLVSWLAAISNNPASITKRHLPRS